MGNRPHSASCSQCTSESPTRWWASCCGPGSTAGGLPRRDAVPRPGRPQWLSPC
uniref:Alternative protein n=1 Tax=Macrostomum lignano TaxID=282301 RepID=A0A1I8FDB1_9PLAT